MESLVADEAHPASQDTNLEPLVEDHRRREAGARRVLAQATVPVATAALGPTQRPHEAIWAPIGYAGTRLRLAELAGVPIPTESEERIEETQEHRWRMEEQR